jgi:hypothetical protein
VTHRWTCALAALAALAACGGQRERPGPPSLTLEPPPGNVVTSPDTFAVQVRASDANGLDSVVVVFLNQRREIPSFNEQDLVDVVLLVVPEGLVVGQLLDLQGYARDLQGERTTVTTSVTVVARDTTAQ